MLPTFGLAPHHRGDVVNVVIAQFTPDTILHDAHLAGIDE